MMLLNKFNDDLSIQEELYEYLRESEAKCVYCARKNIISSYNEQLVLPNFLVVFMTTNLLAIVTISFMFLLMVSVLTTE